MPEKPVYHLSLPVSEVSQLSGDKEKRRCLKVGKWYGNTRTGMPYVVSLDKMKKLVENFYKAKEVGVEVPLMMGHTDDPEKRIGTVVELEISDDWLYATSTIPNEAERAKAKLSPSSVEVTSNYTDGYGNSYDEMLTHLAVVTHPAVPGQGPVIALSLRTKPMAQKWVTRLREGKKPFTYRLAEGDTPPADAVVTDAPPDGSETAPEFDDEQASWLVEKINEYIEYCGDKPLSSDTNGMNFAERFNAFLYYTVSQDNGEESSEPITDDTASEVADSTEPVQMGKKKAGKVTQLEAALAENVALKNRIQLAAKSAFESKAVQLMNAGRLTVDAKNKAIQLAAKSDYDLSILDAIALPESMAIAPSAASKVMAQLSAGKTKPASEKSVSEMTIGELRQHGLRRAGFSLPKKN